MTFPFPFYAYRGGFVGGNAVFADIKSMCEAMASGVVTASPTAGGTLTINGASLGSYDYTIKRGNQTVSSFLNSDWFTTTADSRAAFVVVDGDLTINSGQTFIPSNRKLFTVIYVRGNLAVNGSVSMTARGANHSASGSNIPAAAIKIASGTYSSVVDPEIPAAGALGAAGVVTNNTGVTGGSGTGGQTGGGGSAGDRNGCGSGPGAAGSSFSGGPGGGGADAISGGPSGGGAANGGAGGNANNGGGGQGASGGSGNPGGLGSGTGGANGNNGTGGSLIVICTGNFSGSGTVTAEGSAGVPYSGANGAAGAASGGGSITIMFGADSGPTPSAAGGAGVAPSGGLYGSGAGGNGTARKLAL